MSEKADDVQKADQAVWRTRHKKPMIVVGLLWFAAVLCGSGIWAGSRHQLQFGRGEGVLRAEGRELPEV